MNTKVILNGFRTMGLWGAVLFLAACSDNDDDRDYGSSSSSSSAGSNIVETAIAAGNFTTLVSALQAAELDDDLSDPSADVTVFAPTDDAFEALRNELGDTAYQELLASDDLANILMYHVVGESLTSAEVVAAEGGFISTLAEQNLVVSLDESDVFVNQSQVINTDINATNGVIHVIDKVIVPPSQTITDLVVDNEDFSTLEAAVVQANLASTLSGDGPFTVFAPTNAAFEKLGSDVIDAVLADNDLLTNVLTYHVIDGEVSAAEALSLNGESAQMLNGDSAVINVFDGSVYIDRSKISVTNILTSNGVVHVIDSVITPDGVDVTDGDIVSIVAADDNFSTLVTAVTEADLVTTLQGDGPFTLFAPTNSAFEKLPEGTLESLLADIPTLTDILTYHVYAGEVDSSAAVAAAGSSVTMVNGADAAVTSENGGLFIDGAQIIMTDIPADNGIIHVIDAVMLPE